MSTEETGRDFVEGVLSHAYSSKYYDPVKAREYYLRTRELKGKQNSTSDLSEKGKEGWAYTRNQISEAKQKESETAQLNRQKAGEARQALVEKRRADHAARMEKLRAGAEETAERIASKLSEKLAKIESDLTIPDNASPKLRAFLMKQKARQTNSARKGASSEMAAVRTKVRSALTTARDEYKKASEELRAKHDADRKSEQKNYDAATKARKAKYDRVVDQEFAGLRDNV